jgi:hypothetical protein
MTVDGEGVLEIDVTSHNGCIVTGGTTIQGVRFVDGDGKHPTYTLNPVTNIAETPMFMIESHDGSTLTIVHESGDVSVLRERISVEDGANTAIDAKRVQLFFYPWLGGVGRVRAFDWPGV